MEESSVKNVPRSAVIAERGSSSTTHEFEEERSRFRPSTRRACYISQFKDHPTQHHCPGMRQIFNSIYHFHNNIRTQGLVAKRTS